MCRLFTSMAIGKPLHKESKIPVSRQMVVSGEVWLFCSTLSTRIGWVLKSPVINPVPERHQPGFVRFVFKKRQLRAAVARTEERLAAAQQYGMDR